MPVYRLGSVSVAFSADTNEFQGELRNARRAMEFLRQESRRTGISIGRLAQRAGISEEQFQELARAERVAANATRALARQARNLERRLERLRRSHLNLRNILFTVAGASGFGLAIRNLTQYSAQVSETADSLGLLPSELDRTRRALGSFGLDVLQTDRLLSNIIAKTAEARRGSQRLQQAFETLGGSLDISNPLEQLDLIAQGFSDLEVTSRFEALRLIAGERFAIPLGGLLATEGQLEAELDRVAEKFSDFSDTAVRINKDLDQTFIDLFGIIRINFQNVIAENATAISSVVQQLEDLIPAIANFSDAILSFSLRNRELLGGGIGGAAFGGLAGAGVGRILSGVSGLRGTAALTGLAGALGLTSPIGIGVLVGAASLASIGAYRDRVREAREETERFAEAVNLLRRAQEGDATAFIRPPDVVRRELNLVEQEALDRLTFAEQAFRNAERIVRQRGIDPRTGQFTGPSISPAVQSVLDIDPRQTRESFRQAQLNYLQRVRTELEKTQEEYEQVRRAADEYARVAPEHISEADNLRRVFEIRRSVLIQEAGELSLTTAVWRAYGRELQEVTNNRDIAQLESQIEPLRAFLNQPFGATQSLVSGQLELETAQIRRVIQETEARLSLEDQIGTIVRVRLENEIATQRLANREQQSRLVLTEGIAELSRLTLVNETQQLREQTIALRARFQAETELRDFIDASLENEVQSQRNSNRELSFRLQNQRRFSLRSEEFRGEVLALRESNEALVQRNQLLRATPEFASLSFESQILELRNSNLLLNQQRILYGQIAVLAREQNEETINRLRLENALSAQKITIESDLLSITQGRFESEQLGLRNTIRLQRLRNQSQDDFDVNAGLIFEKENEALIETVNLLERRFNIVRSDGEEYLLLLSRQRRLQEALNILLERDGLLFFNAFNRFLSGISNAVVGLTFNLIQQTEAFENFVAALRNIANQIIRIFVNSGFQRLANNFGFPTNFLLSRGAPGFGGSTPAGLNPRAVEFGNTRIPSSVGIGAVQPQGLSLSPTVNNTYNISSGVSPNQLQAAMENFGEEMRLRILDDLRTNPEVRDSIRGGF